MIGGKKHWLWPAVDQDGVVLDVLVQSWRDKRAAKRLLRKLLEQQARSQRANQNPSRPASNATTIRVIWRPAWVASPRQRSSKPSNAAASAASFFSGWRALPGTMPATSQLAWLISMIAIKVPSWFRAMGDRLKSFGCGMGRSVGYFRRRSCHPVPATP